MNILTVHFSACESWAARRKVTENQLLFVCAFLFSVLRSGRIRKRRGAMIHRDLNVKYRVWRDSRPFSNSTRSVSGGNVLFGYIHRIIRHLKFRWSEPWNKSEIKKRGKTNMARKAVKRTMNAKRRKRPRNFTPHSNQWPINNHAPAVKGGVAPDRPRQKIHKYRAFSYHAHLNISVWCTRTWNYSLVRCVDLF